MCHLKRLSDCPFHLLKLVWSGFEVPCSVTDSYPVSHTVARLNLNVVKWSAASLYSEPPVRPDESLWAFIKSSKL